MTKNIYKLIAELKLLIGYLGEKSQFNWWESNLLGSSSSAFLIPTFPRTTLLAQYHGVSEAALIAHDESVGIGHNYHLFRLPVSIERSVASTVQEMSEANTLGQVLSSKEHALNRLAELADKVHADDGPVNIGIFEESGIEKLIRASAGYYLSAFEQSKRSFPFMRSEHV